MSQKWTIEPTPIVRSMGYWYARPREAEPGDTKTFDTKQEADAAYRRALKEDIENRMEVVRVLMKEFLNYGA